MEVLLEILLITVLLLIVIAVLFVALFKLFKPVSWEEVAIDVVNHEKRRNELMRVAWKNEMEHQEKLEKINKR